MSITFAAHCMQRIAAVSALSGHEVGFSGHKPPADKVLYPTGRAATVSSEAQRSKRSC